MSKQKPFQVVKQAKHMTMRIFIILMTSIFLTVLIQSCSTSRHISGDLAETYYGFLPCADCPGISYTLELDKDGQYRLTKDYYDREFTFTSQGNYTYENGNLSLYEDDKVVERYKKDGDQLIYLDSGGNVITTELASYYTLYPNDSSRAEMPHEFVEDTSAVVYKGTGNEPFWMVKITGNNTMLFTSLIEGDLEFELPVTGTSLSDDNQSVLYTGKDEMYRLEVLIINNPCQDNMSGHDNTTTLEVNLYVDGRKQTLQGCGNFLNKYRLNGIWHLVSIDNKTISAPSTPSLGIYLSDGRIAGSAGCNRFFGSVEDFTNQSVKFSQVGSTRMMCQDMDVEDQYLKLFNQNDIEWKIDEAGRLHLSSSNAGDFVFLRAEEL